MSILSVLAGVGIGMASNPLFSALQPFSVDIEQRAWAFHPVKQSDVLTLINLYLRGKISDKEFKDRIRENGYDEKKAEEFLEVAKQILNANQLIQAKWRGIISEDEYYKKMLANGYDKDEADKLEQVMKYYPSVEDFIRFAVRDVFREDRVKKYKLDDEFPEPILKYTRKSGIDDEILRWYWRAHWNLPGVMEVIKMVNMLQPAVINANVGNGKRYGDKYKDFGLNPDKLITTYDDLDEYLAMADISPFWRDRIKALTFPPITRVDLRRVYELGLIDDNELIARLLELGYSYKDAELLANFYKKLKTEEGRNLTRTMIENGYKEKIISRDDAKKMLEQLGYSSDEAEFILSLDDAKIAEKQLKDKIDLLITKFVNGEITEDELKNQLQQLDISLTKVEYELEKAKIKKEKKSKMPTKEDCLKWLKKGIIDENTFTNIMQRLGYSNEFIQYYIQEVNQ